jgi:ribose transport system permease protein
MERVLDFTSKRNVGREANLLRQVGFPLVLLIVLFAGAGIVNPQFLSWDSLRIQFTLAAFIGIVGIGQTLAILIGQIDLSIPANISLSAILSANVYGRLRIRFSHCWPGRR